MTGEGRVRSLPRWLVWSMATVMIADTVAVAWLWKVIL